MDDPEGRRVGATFLRNNLSKRSMCVDLKQPEGRQLVLNLAPKFDVFAENFKSGAMDRLGLGFAAVSAVHPTCVYASVSGFGNSRQTPYRDWPAFAPIVEAMSGIYEMKRQGDLPPMVSPVGALGDIGAALFAAIGILAALRNRDRHGGANYVDVAMFDSVIAMTDIVTNFWSMGLSGGDVGAVINHGFRAADGWFVMQVSREHHFERLAEIVGHPEWVGDERFDDRQGWVDHLDSIIRPAVEGWAAGKSRMEACESLSQAGIAAGPCAKDEELVSDPHVAARGMLVGIERTDGVDQPVLVPGNPVKIVGSPEGGDRRIPWLGEHTDELLRSELGLTESEIEKLRNSAVVG
jgi:formyl-CoA transferase